MYEKNMIEMYQRSDWSSEVGVSARRVDHEVL